MKYLMRVTGLIEVEAPNAVQALKFARGKGWLLEHVRISAGIRTSLHQCPNRNSRWWEYRVGVRTIPGTKQIELLRPTKDPS